MIVLQNMGGIAPMITPAALSDRLAQTANNLVLYMGVVAHNGWQIWKGKQ